MKKSDSTQSATTLDTYNWPHRSTPKEKSTTDETSQKPGKQRRIKTTTQKILRPADKALKLDSSAKPSQKNSAFQLDWKLICGFLIILIILTIMTIAGYHFGKQGSTASPLLSSVDI